MRDTGGGEWDHRRRDGWQGSPGYRESCPHGGHPPPRHHPRGDRGSAGQQGACGAPQTENAEAAPDLTGALWDEVIRVWFLIALLVQNLPVGELLPHRVSAPAVE